MCEGVWAGVRGLGGDDIRDRRGMGKNRFDTVPLGKRRKTGSGLKIKTNKEKHNYYNSIHKFHV